MQTKSEVQVNTLQTLSALKHPIICHASVLFCSISLNAIPFTSYNLSVTIGTPTIELFLVSHIFADCLLLRNRYARE